MKFRKQREAITKGKIFFHCGDAPRDASHHNGIPCLQTWEDVNRFYTGASVWDSLLIMRYTARYMRMIKTTNTMVEPADPIMAQES